MYGYKFDVVASRGETSHLTKRRVDSSRGKARLLSSPLSPRREKVPRSPFPMPTFSIVLPRTGPTGYIASFLRRGLRLPLYVCAPCVNRERHPGRGGEREREKEEPCCLRVWPQGCFPRRKDLPPLSQIFLPLAMTTIMAPTTFSSLLAGTQWCICFEELETNLIAIPIRQLESGDALTASKQQVFQENSKRRKKKGESFI